MRCFSDTTQGNSPQATLSLKQFAFFSKQFLFLTEFQQPMTQVKCLLYRQNYLYNVFILFYHALYKN